MLRYCGGISGFGAGCGLCPVEAQPASAEAADKTKTRRDRSGNFQLSFSQREDRPISVNDVARLEPAGHPCAMAGLVLQVRHAFLGFGSEPSRDRSPRHGTADAADDRAAGACNGIAQHCAADTTGDGTAYGLFPGGAARGKRHGSNQANHTQRPAHRVPLSLLIPDTARSFPTPGGVEDEEAGAQAWFKADQVFIIDVYFNDVDDRCFRIVLPKGSKAPACKSPPVERKNHASF
ncbi:hypothetical protein [Chelativorans sp. AA-79]|uniref:hypothetical protein n=1 Tax=Chelativorans sp. AA-79 TaxID=3028735 RepID=UPI0023FA0C63|nr:hypothetical protein [Chelativorans sp. AA-79]WEX12050.1 hypothetical protein PVE73_06105 [Chelativorans sp. AA-79]